MHADSALAWRVFLLLLVVPACVSAGEYLVGGPLAGLTLPPYPTQHGEAPGYPGCIPSLKTQGGTVQDMGNEYREWGPQGMAPEMHLYPGSVEHWRAYMFKYMPIRSFFDRQSQLRNWTAPDLPGAQAAHAERYAEPVYWVPRHADPRPTSRHHRPVPVVRMKTGAPVLALDLGELPIGLYVLRVIGAVETKQCRPFRQPLFLRATVNDGPKGEASTYRLRLGYCDEFYSVAECYFHALMPRRYRAQLAVDRGSKVDLLVHNVSLDDVLAGAERRALKSRTTLGEALAIATPPTLDEPDRLKRDAAIWRGFPHENAQGSGITVGHGGYASIRGVTAGAADMTGEAIQQEHGAWVPWGRDTRDMVLPEGLDPRDVLLANPKLGLVYPVDDLRRGRPLPDPYPFKDDGAGLYLPDPADPAKGRVWTPIGARVHRLRLDYYNGIGRSLQRAEKDDSYDDAHDAAVALVRWAYAFPTLDYAEYLSNTVCEAGPFGRDLSCRRRATAANFLPHYQQYVKPILFHYDRLFEFIRGDAVLAKSVGRFVPWVKTPDDVVKLLDVYLVQTTAKRILRYHYHTDPMDIANLAAIVGDTRVTDPWMEWLFSRTFIYPLPVAGIQDTMISGTTREGTEIVGSTYYAQGEGAERVAAALDRYRAAGGSRRFDLSDPARYPKPVAHAFWRFENVVSGWDFLRVGDVCGPDKWPGHTLRNLGFARAGWRWTRDPRFAFILKHYVGRGQTDAEDWAAIEKAAALCPRAPWLGNRSRVLPMWAGILESGTEHDDPRFRRAATVRVGYGMGHHHDDTLDLQLVAHGLPMTIDGGQRPGYASPADRTTRIHNVVEVDSRNHRDHSWVTALADHSGCRYLAAEAVPPPGASLFRRQVALIDADDGLPARKLPPEKQRPGAELPKGVTTPNGYVFDVFRVRGGKTHTYCFHGPLNDDFEWNAKSPAPPKAGDEAEYLRIFKERQEAQFAGDAPHTLVATWRMATEVPGTGGGEKEMLGRNYVPGAPRKFTRIHLLGVGDCRALRAQAVCRRWKYEYTNLMVQRKAPPVPGGGIFRDFVAIVEPYVGEPFIESVSLLTIGKPSEFAYSRLAVQVKTTNGHTDVCFADPEPTQEHLIGDARIAAAGEFAYHSIDAAGFRQATLAGGTTLKSPHVRISASETQREAKIVKADYLAKRLWIEPAWPASSRPVVCEVGRADGHWTTYTAVRVEPAGKGSVLTFQRGADYYRSEVRDAKPDGTVVCTLKPLCDTVRGGRRGWTASDDDATRFWRADHAGGTTFKLAGGPVSKDAFGTAGVLRLWEYGVGDTIRHRTSVSVRRVAPDTFALEADMAVAIALPCRSLQFSADGKVWTTPETEAVDGWHTLNLSAERVLRAPVLLRLER